MTRRIQWSRAALDDIKVQIAYIGRDNPDAASRLAAALRHEGDRLGRAAAGRAGRVAGTFEKTIGKLPYILAYSVDRSGGDETLTILRVIHTRRDWPSGTWPA